MTRFVRFAAVTLAASALYATPSFAASAVDGKWNLVADTQMGQMKSTLTVAEAGGAGVARAGDDAGEAMTHDDCRSARNPPASLAKRGTRGKRHAPAPRPLLA